MTGGPLAARERGPEPDGSLDHVERAATHGLGALRCYVTLLAVELERRGHRLLRTAVLLGVGLVGLALLAAGLGRFLEREIGVAGAGSMITGGAILALPLGVALWARGR